MATADDLKNTLKKLLLRNGVLDRIEAYAKSEVFSALDKEAPPCEISSDADVDEITFLINELILEYMRFNE